MVHLNERKESKVSSLILLDDLLLLRLSRFVLPSSRELQPEEGTSTHGESKVHRLTSFDLTGDGNEEPASVDFLSFVLLELVLVLVVVPRLSFSV